MSVKLIVDNAKTKIICDAELMEEISDLLSFEIDGASFAMEARPGWDGRTRLLRMRRDGSGWFPTGLLREVYTHCKKKGVPIDAQSVRAIPEAILDIEMRDLFRPRGYQIRCRELSQENSRGVLVIGTGGGKTYIACHLIDEKKVKTLFVTPDTDLREQTYNTFKEHFKGDVVSKNIEEGKPITVSNIQALARKDKKFFKDIGMIIIDEFHHSGATTYLKLNDVCVNAYYRYGLTGTFLRSDGKDMVMHGVLSRVIFQKTTSELIEEGYLVRPYIDIIKHRVKGYSRMSYAVAYKKICEDLEFAELVSNCAMEKIRKGLQTLILVRRIEHGKILESMIDGAVFLNGSMGMDYREEIKKKFNDKKVQAIIATNIFGEGTDIPSIEALINARLEKTEIQTRQGIGRSLRMYAGKEKVEVVDFMIEGQQHLNSHSRTRLSTYKRETAFVVNVTDKTPEQDFVFMDELLKL